MRISIFAKLAIAFLVILAGLVAFLAVIASRELEQSFDALVEEREARVENGIGLEVDLLLSGLESQLAGMADNFDLRRRLAELSTGGGPVGDRDLIDRAEELANIADLNRLWIVSPDGILLAAGHDKEAFGDNLIDPPGTYSGRLSRALEGESVRAVGVETIAAESSFLAEVFLPVTMTDRFLGREQVIAVLWAARVIDEDFMARAADLAGAEMVAVAEGVPLLMSWQSSEEPLDAALLDALESGPGEIELGDDTYGLATLPFPGSEAHDPSTAVTLHLLIPKSDLLARRRALLGALLLEAGLGGLVAILLAFLVAKSMTLPIERLKTAVTALASGDLSRRVEVRSRDEVEDLVKAFNVMADDLDANTRRLVEAEKLSAWREVARRLAHEIKNPLSPIKLSIQNLVRVYTGNPETFEPTLRETSETILEEVDRLKTLADEFSNFARMPKPVLSPGDLGEVVHGVVALFDRPESGVAIELECAEDLPTVQMDRDAMSRVFTNLMKNAVEAMEGREGKVRVSAAAVAVGEAPWVQVAVRDQGVGMDETALKHSFNPYFTTKPGGSGLGLAIAQSIVTDHNGRISIASEVGKGTIVTVELPAV